MVQPLLEASAGTSPDQHGDWGGMSPAETKILCFLAQSKLRQGAWWSNVSQTAPDVTVPMLQ